MVEGGDDVYGNMLHEKHVMIPFFLPKTYLRYPANFNDSKKLCGPPLSYKNGSLSCTIQ